MASPAGMEVPEGGSSCAKCQYYDPASDTPHGTCGNANFVKWNSKNGGDPPENIPLPPTRYCCNWYDWDDRPGKEETDG